MCAGSSDPEDLKNWQKLREEAKKALVSFKDNARLNPSLLDASAAKPLACQLADAVRIRGDAWSECREYDKAIADYGEAIRLNPNDFVPTTIAATLGFVKASTIRRSATTPTLCPLPPKMPRPTATAD